MPSLAPMPSALFGGGLHAILPQRAEAPACVASDLQRGAQFGFTIAPFLATVTQGPNESDRCDEEVELTLASGATATLSHAFVKELVSFVATSALVDRAGGPHGSKCRFGSGPHISTPTPVGIDEAPPLAVTTERAPGWVPIAHIPLKEPPALPTVYGTNAERTACEEADAALIVNSAVIAHDVVPMSVLSIVVAPYMARIVCALPEALGAVTELPRWDSTQLPAAAVPKVTSLSTVLGAGLQRAQLPPRLTELNVSSPHVQMPLALETCDFCNIAMCQSLRRLTLWGQVPVDSIVEASQRGACFPQVEHVCAVLPEDAAVAAKVAASLSRITPAATSLALYVLTQHWGTFLSKELALPAQECTDDAQTAAWPRASTLSLTVEGGSSHEWFGIEQILTCRPWAEFELKQDGVFCQNAACADTDTAQLGAPTAPQLKRLRLPRKQECLTDLVSRVVPLTSEHTPSLSRLELCSTNEAADLALLTEIVRSDSPLTAPVTEVAFLVDDFGNVMNEYRRVVSSAGAAWKKLERPPAPRPRGLQVVLRDPAQ